MKYFLITAILIAIMLIGASCEEERERIRRPRMLCEETGGLFYPGGAFGADNCVFPPDSKLVTERDYFKELAEDYSNALYECEDYLEELENK